MKFVICAIVLCLFAACSGEMSDDTSMKLVSDVSETDPTWAFLYSEVEPEDPDPVYHGPPASPFLGRPCDPDNAGTHVGCEDPGYPLLRCSNLSSPLDPNDYTVCTIICDQVLPLPSPAFGNYVNGKCIEPDPDDEDGYPCYVEGKCWDTDCCGAGACAVASGGRYTCVMRDDIPPICGPWFSFDCIAGAVYLNKCDYPFNPDWPQWIKDDWSKQNCD